MKLRIFEYRHREDFGHDFYIHILCFYNWSLVQSCFSAIQYGSKFPYLNITMGSGRLLSVNFQWLNFGLTIELLSRSWFPKKY